MRFKSFAVLLAIVTVLLPGCLFAASSVAPASSSRAVAYVAPTMPLSFEPTGTPDRFLARSGRYAMLIGPNQSSVAVSDSKSKSSRVFHFAFDNANTSASIEALDMLPGITNYYVGKDPQSWRVGVKNFAKVRTKQIYPGVDVVFYGDQRQLEFDFVVAPNADPKPIALNFSGTDKLYVDGGDLVAQLGGESVRFVKPFAYQLVDGKRNPVSVEYTLDNGKAHLRLGDYDKQRELVIDPILSYATYLGGNQYDVANGIAADASGNSYVTGQTCSTSGFPLATGPDGSCYAFVSKLSFNAATNVTTLAFSTFFGGQNSPTNVTATSGSGITVDKQTPPNVYMIGTTNFKYLAGAQPNPVGRPQAYNGGDSDAFVVILSSADGQIQRTTYLGGGNSDAGFGIAVDSQLNVTAVGSTCSLDFPTYNGFQAMLEDCAGFATKLDFGLHIAPPIVPGTSALSPRPPSATEACEAAGNLCPVSPDASSVYYYYSAIYNGQLGQFPPEATWPVDVNGHIIGGYSSGVAVPEGAITYATPVCPLAPAGISYPAQVLFASTTSTSGGLVWQGGECTCLTKGCAVADRTGFDWVILGPVPIYPKTPVHASTEAYAVALDPAGDAFVVGGTNTPSLAPYSTWSTVTGPWIMKIHGQDERGYHAGDAVYSSGLGTNPEGPTHVNAANAVAVDLSGQAFVAGTATSGAGIWTTSGAPHSGYIGGAQDAFVMMLDIPGQHVMYGTYLGGGGTDQGLGLALDGTGIYMVGSTTSPSSSLAVVNPLYDQATNTTESELSGPQDGLLVKITPISSQGVGGDVLMSAYLGGTGYDSANAVAASPNGTGDFYIAGSTNSVTFPVKNAVAGQGVSTGAGDAFVAMVSGASFPAVSVTPTSLDFGSQVVGFSSTTTRTVTITNTSQAILNITKITTCSDPAGACTPNTDFAITGNTCGNQLTPSGGTKDNCTVTLTFTPSQIGTRNGTLTVIDNAPTSPQAVSLTGTGTGVGSATVNPTSIDFGSQNVGTTSAVRTVTVTNSDTTQSLVIGTVVATPAEYQISSNGCTSLLAHGASCTIGVTFTPAAAGSRPGGTLVINGNASNFPFSVSLTGTGNGSGTTPSTTNIISTTTTSLSTNAGGSVSFTVGLAQGQTDPVNLTCSPSNVDIGCTISPTTINTSAPTATVKLTVPGGTASPKYASLHFERSIFLATLLPFGLVGLIAVRKRGIMIVGLVLLVFASIVFSVGCSSTSKAVSGGSYQISVTGTSSTGAQQTVRVTLNVY